MTREGNKHATQTNGHLNTWTSYVINGWQSIRAEVKEEINQCWPFQDGITAIDV